MNTKNFLNGLDYDQLEFARQYADQLIKRKENEERVALFVVSDEDLNYAAFRVEQYSEGVERLCKEIREFAERNPGEDIAFVLQKHRFIDSEVEDMLKL